MKTSLKLIAAFAAIALAGNSQASLLVYEGFQTNTVGNLIGQASGGNGTTGNWAQATADLNQNWTVNNSFSLSYSNGEVNVSGGTQNARGNFTGGTAAEAAHIQLTSGLASTTGNTFYMSFLFGVLSSPQHQTSGVLPHFTSTRHQRLSKGELTAQAKAWAAAQQSITSACVSRMSMPPTFLTRLSQLEASAAREG